MLIGVLAFAVVFICRDVQVLTTADRKALGARFAFYALLILTAAAVVAGVIYAQPEIVYGWTRRRFALVAVLIQLAELGLALALRKWTSERYHWVGCILPCPAFLAVLFVMSYAIQHAVIQLDAIAAAEIVTTCWLGLVGALTLFLSRANGRQYTNEEPADRQFVDDFALMTSCTALIFVPYGIF